MKHVMFTCLLTCILTPLAGQVAEQDSLALVALYNSTGGPSWDNQDGWLTASPVSDWYGITVSGQHVTVIDLYENNLTGTLPDEIGDLVALERLDVAVNHITGTLPETLGNLSVLIHLSIYVNEFTGTLPESLSNCTNLRNITAYRNAFSGPFPEVCLSMPQLYSLELGNNAFTGEIPAAINTLTQLELLDLANNQFFGQAPSFAGLTNLIECHLRENMLEGQLEQILDYHPNLAYLTLGNNRFSGCVFNHHFDSNRLIWFDLQDNDFDCISSFNHFSNIIRLRLQGNRFAFEFLEINIGIPQFFYSPQRPLLDADTISLPPGGMLTIDSGSDGNFTEYQWYHNGIPMANETLPLLSIEDFTPSQAGVYHCEMTNTMVPGLTLHRNPVTLVVEGASSITSQGAQRSVVYPNPAVDFVQFTGIGSSSTIVVIDLAGHVVLEQSIAGHDALDLTSLMPGMYFIKILTGEYTAIHRICKLESGQ